MLHVHARLVHVLGALAGTPPQIEVAIDGAVEAWRLHRHPDLADLVDGLCGRRARELEKEREGQSYRTFAPVPARYRTSSAADACLAVVYGTLEIGWSYQDGKLEQRDDPRLAQALARVLFEKRFLFPFGQSEDYVDRYLQVLVELGDVRQAAPMQAILDSANPFPSPAHEAFARPRYEAAVQALERRAKEITALPDDVRALLDPLLAELAPELAKTTRGKVAPRFQSKGAAEALAAVFESPDDLTARQVCADRLSELGDPRGEYVSLAFASAAGPLPPKSQKQMDALFHKNAGHWAGALGPIGTREGMRYEHGFVSEICLEKSSLGLTREMWDAALVADEWATVHTLHVTERPPDWWLKAFFESSRSHRLRRVVFRVRVYGPTKPKPLAILERPASAPPGSPYRLTLASPKAPKLEKVLRAFDPSQLALLLEDAERLGASAARVTSAIQKMLAPAKRAKKPRTARRVV
jgi:uncharacterized protein (TIGR02996 family)